MNSCSSSARLRPRVEAVTGSCKDTLRLGPLELREGLREGPSSAARPLQNFMADAQRGHRARGAAKTPPCPPRARTCLSIAGAGRRQAAGSSKLALRSGPCVTDISPLRTAGPSTLTRRVTHWRHTGVPNPLPQAPLTRVTRHGVMCALPSCVCYPLAHRLLLCACLMRAYCGPRADLLSGM
jgi:hypothetical protein